MLIKTKSGELFGAQPKIKNSNLAMKLGMLRFYPSSSNKHAIIVQIPRMKGKHDPVSSKTALVLGNKFSVKKTPEGRQHQRKCFHFHSL